MGGDDRDICNVECLLPLLLVLDSLLSLLQLVLLLQLRCFPELPTGARVEAEDTAATAVKDADQRNDSTEQPTEAATATVAASAQQRRALG
jgi:hypothetical protein